MLDVGNKYRSRITVVIIRHLTLDKQRTGQKYPAEDICEGVVVSMRKITQGRGV